ncbi:carboxypeptidase regulatory-like domain-containing protein [Lysobacter sp. S4-A87]|uniref:carboxypeptidase regulatory-like domain-containing protein n=1 Tax=Lysobacter sp. S4-A87 TaxID=2925843 RepID=UPI001F531471|nr:carboxypeptidase regulatory-like domain-containing protein [Lysobacter sp. S4-A87]UNK47899.1 carboxypeptidase regulatory-like domain-containing protein [Lysobacter sp. S4-A87]
MTAPAFNLPLLVAALLAITAVVASARLLRRQWRAQPAQRSRGWRIVLLLLAQPVCATLLYFALVPPSLPGEAGTLVVATAGATTEQLGAGRGGEAFVALPEAPPLGDVERAPDLATALRQHPGTQRVRIVGAGLEARDRDAARGLALEFSALPLPRGLVELQAPRLVVAGADFVVGGRANDLPGGSAELIDPGRRRVDRIALPADGRFTLTASPRVAGTAGYIIRLRDARQAIVEDVDLPLQAAAATPPRVLLMAGAPGPEVEYLRRWARDAGLTLQTQVSVGGGMQLGDAPVAINAPNLGRFDLVILDERAWSALGDSQRAALNDAINTGLGVLLRVTATPSPAERRRLQALGFAVAGGSDSATVKLATPARDEDATRARIGPGTPDAPRLHDAALPDLPALTRRDLRIQPSDAVPLLRDDAGGWLAAWRAQGRGRVALWTLTDSYRLVLAGRDDLHGEMWSSALATIGRAQARSELEIEGEPRQHGRIALCALGAGANVRTPSGDTVALLRDPSTGSRNCAAFWPRHSGWHQLRSGEQSLSFFVRAPAAAPGLRAGEMRDATARLAAGSAVNVAAAVSVPGHPGERWPWWLAWLLASAATWWQERSRFGRRA